MRWIAVLYVLLQIAVSLLMGFGHRMYLERVYVHEEAPAPAEDIQQIIPDYDKRRFRSRAEIRKIPDLKLAVVKGSYFAERAPKVSPDLDVVELDSASEYFESRHADCHGIVTVPETVRLPYTPIIRSPSLPQIMFRFCIANLAASSTRLRPSSILTRKWVSTDSPTTC